MVMSCYDYPFAVLHTAMTSPNLIVHAMRLCQALAKLHSGHIWQYSLQLVNNDALS